MWERKLDELINYSPRVKIQVKIRISDLVNNICLTYLFIIRGQSSDCTVKIISPGEDLYVFFLEE